MQAVRPLLLGEKDVAAAAPPLREIIDIVEATYRMEAEGKADVPPKIGVHPGRPGAFLHAMPAWVSGAAALGMKWVSYLCLRGWAWLSPTVCPTGEARGQAPGREYNCAIPTKKQIMEAEKITALASSLADLGERAREMRRYL